MATTTGKLELKEILRLLSSIDHVPGDIAECGVFHGETLKVLAMAKPSRTAFGFDTFSGLPAEAWSEGEPHSVGDFSNTSFEKVYASLKHLPNARLIQGLFPDSARHIDTRFAFVYLDLDFHRSTRDAVQWFLPRMSPGGIIVFDDYDWPYCPGVKHAIEECGLAVKFTAAPHQVFFVAAVPLDLG